MKKILLSAFFLCLTGILISQSDSTYLINRYGTAISSNIIYNPAFAGVEGRHTLNINYKTELPEISDNPQTFTADYSGALGKKKNIGIGAYYYHHKSFFNLIKKVELAVSYKIRFKNEMNLRIGASALSFNRFKFINTKILFEGAREPHDPLLLDITTQDNPHVDQWEFNAGLWFEYKHFYTGFSYLKFYSFIIDKNTQYNYNKLHPEFYLNTGYDFIVSDKWGITPYIFLKKLQDYEKIFYELSIFADYSNTLVAGITYKQNEQLSLTAGALIFNRYRFLVSYGTFTDSDRRKILKTAFWQAGLRFQY